MKRSDLPEEYFCCEDFRDVIHALEDQAVPRMEEEHLMWLWQRGVVVPLSDAYLEAVSLQQCDGICHGEHDWEDDSYGGPESGCMAAHCKRCGYSFHTTLY